MQPASPSQLPSVSDVRFAPECIDCLETGFTYEPNCTYLGEIVAVKQNVQSFRACRDLCSDSPLCYSVLYNIARKLCVLKKSQHNGKCYQNEHNIHSGRKCSLLPQCVGATSTDNFKARNLNHSVRDFGPLIWNFCYQIPPLALYQT